jgi:hypothetical protein
VRTVLFAVLDLDQQTGKGTTFSRAN